MMKIEWVVGAPYVCLNEGKTLVIDYIKWMDLTKQQRKALLEHELMHNEMRTAYLKEQAK